MKVNVKIVMCTLLTLAIVVPVSTYVNSQIQHAKQIEAGIVVRYPLEGAFGVYWDYECTDPVVSIDYGDVPQLSFYTYFYKTIYIRNEQADEEIRIYWNSTLSDVTTEIYDSWFSNGTNLYEEEVQWTDYRITIPSNTAIGTYNWTLTIWAEY